MSSKSRFARPTGDRSAATGTGSSSVTSATSSKLTAKPSISSSGGSSKPASTVKSTTSKSDATAVSTSKQASTKVSTAQTATSAPVDMEKHVKALLQLDTFQGKCDADALAEKLGAPLMERAKQTPKDFDPKPWMTVFEVSIERLQHLRSQLDKHIANLEHDEHRAEIQFRARAEAMDNDFTELQHAFEHLETGITEVGSTAITVGEQLETVDRQRSRGSEARALLGYYLEFAFGKGAGERLEDVRNHGADGQFQVAVICRRLKSIAKDVHMDATKSAKERIERYCEHFEQSVLEEFGEAYKAGDLEYVGMCARVLLEFNGGQGCVQMYLNEHGFFAANAELVPETENDDRGKRNADLAEWAREPPSVDGQLKRLLQEIVDVVYAEWDVISRVFPNAVSVMQQFIQRIFAFTLQNYVEQLVARAQGISPLRQLRVLTVTKRAVSRCVVALKKFDEEVIQKLDLTSGSSSLATSMGDMGGSVTVTAPTGTVSSVLDRCLEDLFASYTDKSRYLDAETKVLENTYSDILALFREFQSQRKAVLKSQSTLYRTLNQLADAAGQNVGEGPKITVPIEEGMLKVDLAIKMMMVHAEAVGRCHELSSSNELLRNMRSLFKQLLENVNHNYVDVAMETALDDLKISDGKSTEPELAELGILVTADRIARLIQRHFETCVLPFLVNSPAMLREMMAEKNNVLGLMESKSNSLMHRQIDVIMNWLGVILAKQKKTDYKCKDEEIDIMSLSTPVCNQACEFLGKVHTAAKAHMHGSGRNHDIFLTEVGVCFHAMLLDHFKKFTVNATGGLVISKDIALYQEAVDAFSIRICTDRFEMLRELANVYLVKPSILRSILHEGHLGKLDYKVVLPFLQMREDWSSAKIEREIKSEAGPGDL